MSKVAVVFWSGTGNTEAMAQAIAEGISQKGGTADVLFCSDVSVGALDEYDAIAFGCPAMGAEELESDEFQPLWDAAKEMLGMKPVALFGSYEWAEGEWMETWKADADDAGINVVDTLTCYDAPDDDAVASCYELGAKLA